MIPKFQVTVAARSEFKLGPKSPSLGGIRDVFRFSVVNRRILCGKSPHCRACCAARTYIQDGHLVPLILPQSGLPEVTVGTGFWAPNEDTKRGRRHSERIVRPRSAHTHTHTLSLSLSPSITASQLPSNKALSLSLSLSLSQYYC